MKWYAATLSVALTLLPASNANADASSKQKKVSEMIRLLRIEESTNQLVQAQQDRIELVSQQQLSGVKLDVDQKEHFSQFQEQVVKLLRTSAGWKALEPDYLKLYSDTYSEAELDGILQFYHSPAGRAMLARTPELTEKTIAISKHRMEELNPKIQELVDQFMRAMQ